MFFLTDAPRKCVLNTTFLVPIACEGFTVYISEILKERWMDCVKDTTIDYTANRDAWKKE